MEEASGLAEQGIQFEVGAEPVVQSKRNVSVTPQPPISNTVAPENQNSQRIAESEQTNIKAGKRSENVEVAQGLMPIKEAPGITKQVTRFENGAEPEER